MAQHFKTMELGYVFLILMCLRVQGERLTSRSVSDRTMPDRVVYRQDGDFVVGALLALRGFHEETRICGKIPDYGAVRRAEAVAYAVDRINQNPAILPNTTIGYEIYDTCYDRSLALENSLKFTRNFRDIDNVIGVVGTSLSSTAELTTTFLSIFEITMVSHFATSDELSDTLHYPYFMRTIPPDSYQIMAIIDILNHFGWEYVAFIYSESLYGRRAYDIFTTEITTTGICVSYSRSLGLAAKEVTYRETIDELLKIKRDSLFSAVVLFAELENIHGLMRMASQRNVTGQFIWIGSDSFGIPCLHSVLGTEEAALGAFTIIPKAGTSDSFDDHFRREVDNSFSENPWIAEYREEEGNRVSDCPAFESLVADAVEVIARGLDRLCVSSCNYSDLVRNRPLLQKYLTGVKFNSSANGPVFFPENGDPPGRYDIRQLYKDHHGNYRFRTVGNWTAIRGLEITPQVAWFVENVSGRYSSKGIPKSICSDPCPTYQRRVFSENQPCCWQCENCADDKLVIDWTCQKSCINRTSGVYQWPSQDRKNCTDLEELPIAKTGMSITVILIGLLGMISTLTVSWFYVEKREEKLVKASSRELSYIILVGLFFNYLSAVIYRLNASITVCTLSRIIPHVAISLIYVSIATITVRLFRIFKAGKKSIKRPSFISPTSQVVTTMLLSLLPFLWGVVWLIAQPPRVEVIDPTTDRQYIVRVCSLSKGHRIGQLVWDIVVVTICCYFAFRARNLPANYNQSRFIAFSVFSTLVVYIAFAPALFTSTTDSSMLDIYSALGALIQSTVVLVLVFIVRLFAVYYVDIPDTSDSMPSSHGASRVRSSGVHSMDNFSS